MNARERFRDMTDQERDKHFAVVLGKAHALAKDINGAVVVVSDCICPATALETKSGDALDQVTVMLAVAISLASQASKIVSPGDPVQASVIYLDILSRAMELGQDKNGVCYATLRERLK